MPRRILLLAFFMGSAVLTNTMNKNKLVEKFEVHYSRNGKSITAWSRALSTNGEYRIITTVTKFFDPRKDNQGKEFFITANKFPNKGNRTRSLGTIPNSYTVMKLKGEIKKFEKGGEGGGSILSSPLSEN